GPTSEIEVAHERVTGGGGRQEVRQGDRAARTFRRRFLLHAAASSLRRVRRARAPVPRLDGIEVKWASWGGLNEWTPRDWWFARRDGNGRPGAVCARRRGEKDPIGANLDRYQVIKGWLDASGAVHEKIYDVAWSGGRTAGTDGKPPPVGTTVNVADATYENSIGGSELIRGWADPDFDPARLHVAHLVH